MGKCTACGGNDKLVQGCEHTDDCTCIEGLDKVSTDELTEEMQRRDRFEVDRAAAEEAYRALVAGDAVYAQRLMSRVLFPNGCDLIAAAERRKAA